MYTVAHVFKDTIYIITHNFSIACQFNSDYFYLKMNLKLKLRIGRDYSEFRYLMVLDLKI